MNVLKRYRFVFLVLGLFVAYCITRIFHLTLLPIFTDEAIYIRWSQIGGTDSNWRFISLTDGKQPLFTWIMMITLRIFKDPLFAGRMVSVGAGIGSFLGIAVLAHELFHSKRIILLSMFLYVFSPFSLMYDKLALYDSLSAAIAIWNIYIAVLLVRRIRLDIALIFGLVLGAGMLNKTSGFIAIYLLPVTLILFDWKSKHWKKNLMKWGLYCFIAFLLSQLMYGVLRLSPFYHMISDKDSVFVYPFKEWYHLFPSLVGNLRGLFDWLTGYLTWPIFLSALAAPIIIWFKEKKYSENLRVSLLLLGFCFVPLGGLAYFAKVLYPRYILFMALPLLILSGYTFSWLLQKTKGQYYSLLFSLLLLFPSLRASYFIVANPTYAPIPASDRGQLIDDWPSGYGVKETVQFISEEATKGKVAVYTEGTFGLLPYGIEIYLVRNPNVTIKGIWPLPKTIPAEIANSAKKQPTFFITNQTQKTPAWPIQYISGYRKGTNKVLKLKLYRVINSSSYAVVP